VDELRGPEASSWFYIPIMNRRSYDENRL
jgi:hypothetical protein